jgi:folate-binding protein YgfZ
MTPSTAATAAEEYRALREAVAFLDLSAWTVLRTTGPDTRAFLQGVATQDLEADPEGSARETLFLNEKGRPIALAWIQLDPEGSGAWILADEGARESLLPHLLRFRVMEDVDLTQGEEVPSLVGLAGPARHPLLQELARQHEGAVTIRAEPLSFLLLPKAPLFSLPTVRTEAYEAWRLSVGLPRTGVDFDAARIATELTLPEAISLTKGCYVGQEVVARTSHRGHVRRRRVGFRFGWGGEPLPHGTEIRVESEPAGFLTSSAPEPGTGQGLGMGYLTLEVLERGSGLSIGQGSMTIPIQIAAWPL